MVKNVIEEGDFDKSFRNLTQLEFIVIQNTVLGQLQ